jgi:hypothetical protein
MCVKPLLLRSYPGVSGYEEDYAGKCHVTAVKKDLLVSSHVHYAVTKNALMILFATKM